MTPPFVFAQVAARQVVVGDLLANQGTVTAVVSPGDGAEHFAGPVPEGRIRIEVGDGFSTTCEPTHTKIIGRRLVDRRSPSTFWSPDDDRMLAIWVEHGYPERNDVAHLLDVTVRAVNIMRTWQGITADLVEVPRELVADEVAAHLAFQGLTASDADTLRSVAATVRKVLSAADPASAAPEWDQLSLLGAEGTLSDQPEVTP